jgi:hypothetical protein
VCGDAQNSLIHIFKTTIEQQRQPQSSRVSCGANSGLVAAGALSVSALQLVVNDWLHACLNAGDVVSHGVHASLGRVDLDDVFQLCLAALQLILPEFALGLAIFNHLVFWVLSLLEHLLHIAYL